MPRRGLALTIGLLVVAAVAAGLLVGLWPRGADGVHRLQAGDDGSVVEVGVGEQIALELEGNPTTGYHWDLAAADPVVLVLSGEPEYESSGGGEGAGGTYTFRFEAVGIGETTLGLVYRGPGVDGETAGSFTCTVVVG